MAPSLMLAYGVGRIGCHMSGDGDWGIANLNPKPEWLQFLPIGCGHIHTQIMSFVLEIVTLFRPLWGILF